MLYVIAIRHTSQNSPLRISKRQMLRDPNSTRKRLIARVHACYLCHFCCTIIVLQVQQMRHRFYWANALCTVYRTVTYYEFIVPFQMNFHSIKRVNNPSSNHPLDLINSCSILLISMHGKISEYSYYSWILLCLIAFAYANSPWCILENSRRNAVLIAVEILSAQKFHESTLLWTWDNSYCII